MALSKDTRFGIKSRLLWIAAIASGVAAGFVAWYVRTAPPSELRRVNGLPEAPTFKNDVRPPSGTLQAVYTLPYIPLGPYLEGTLRLPLGSVDDHKIKLGGVSGLWRDHSDGPGIFWLVTDRGGNGQITVGTESRRTFPVPEFAPTILKVKLENGTIQILDSIPIKTRPGIGVTGLPNFLPTGSPESDEQAWDCPATTKLDPKQSGLDTEDLVRTSDGNFWVVEEYRPSILKVAPDGLVLKRFVPIDPVQPLASAGYTIVQSLPSIYGFKRKQNRGFEGLAISPNQKTLFAALQSPLLNPTAAVGNASRNTRILVFDIESEQPVAEYVYRFDVPTIATYATTDPSEMKISAVVALDSFRLLVDERTDAAARLYSVDIRQATNILGTVFDAPATTPHDPNVESESGFGASGVVALPKELVIDLSTIPGVPPKVEGVAVLDDGQTIAVANDNDLGLGTFTVTPTTCTLSDSRQNTLILFIKIDRPLK